MFLAQLYLISMRKVDTTSFFTFQKKKNTNKKKERKGEKNEVKFNCTVFADKYYDIGK